MSRGLPEVREWILPRTLRGALASSLRSGKPIDRNERFAFRQALTVLWANRVDNARSATGAVVHRSGSAVTRSALRPTLARRAASDRHRHDIARGSHLTSRLQRLRRTRDRAATPVDNRVGSAAYAHHAVGPQDCQRLPERETLGSDLFCFPERRLLVRAPRSVRGKIRSRAIAKNTRHDRQLSCGNEREPCTYQIRKWLIVYQCHARCLRAQGMYYNVNRRNQAW
jgi:hypothetical protein